MRWKIKVPQIVPVIKICELHQTEPRHRTAQPMSCLIFKPNGVADEW